MSSEPHAEAHAHPGPKTYAIIAAILCVITAVEYGIFSAESLRSILVPVLVVLSTIKFSLVVMFYMHLKFDHAIFTRILLAGILVGFVVMLWLFSLYTYSHPIGEGM